MTIFRDTLVSLIHDNKQLSPIQKFHYLISTVSDSAASIVRLVLLSVVNYHIVRQTLNERFNNTRLLLNANLDKLFRFSLIQVGYLDNLKRFVNTLQENVVALKALDTEDLSDFFLLYIAFRVLNSTMKQLFEFKYHNETIPTFDILLDFVQIRC